jgi:excisionase family DNA binding protein
VAVQLMTYKQAMGLLGISRATLRRLVEAGDLPVIRVGERSIRFSEADIVAYVESRRAGALAKTATGA